MTGVSSKCCLDEVMNVAPPENVPATVDAIGDFVHYSLK